MSVFGDDLTDSIIEGHLTLETSESEKLHFLRNVETLCFDRADIAVDYGHLIHERPYALDRIKVLTVASETGFYRSSEGSDRGC